MLRPALFFFLACTCFGRAHRPPDPAGGGRGALSGPSFATPGWSLYHKTDALLAALHTVAANCPIARLRPLLNASRPAEDTTPFLIIDPSKNFNLTPPNDTPRPKPLRIALVFGEHGRELITSELALHLVTTLCSPASADSASFLKQIGDAVLFIVPVAVPGSRREAEAGAACQRLNGNGVDVNRNWGMMWGGRDETTLEAEERPGERAFSERETRAIRGLVEEVRPDAYVSVHSGGEAVVYPWDHSSSVVPGEVGKRLARVGRELARLHCPRCFVGQAYGLFKYRAFGTGADFVFGVLKVPFVFTWEIYGDGRADEDDCFRMFNPGERAEYERTVERWTGAVGSLASMIRDIRAGEGSSAAHSADLVEEYAVVLVASCFLVAMFGVYRGLRTARRTQFWDRGWTGKFSAWIT